MDKPFVAAWGVIILAVAGLIFVSLHRCNTAAPKPVIQDAPVKVAMSESPKSALVADVKHSAHPPAKRQVKVSTCIPNGLDCGFILTRR